MSRGLRTTFLIHSVVAFAFGIATYLLPKTWAALVGWTPFDPSITRGYGAAMLALAVSSWFGYRAAGWEQVRIVVQMEIAFTVLGTLAAMYEALFAGGPLFLWVGIAIFAPFAAAWVYFYWRAKAWTRKG
jgi:hypothetical protein